nr:MAG TPA: hypothetical protein [Caudoviricetes sp.]
MSNASFSSLCVIVLNILFNKSASIRLTGT